ncbi:hypothetical protein [Bradyrhizobium sp. Leo121]|uniref:hypothetical protein n=1 Tax=Bradyrhizobium sp. Leo121 TaxID=1571195 RepID=UPI0010288735|nr:hypothetical protein [Bradyrhizobium sp. Leo121]
MTADIKPEALMVVGGGDRGYFFSTGSITFIGSLCHNRYDNDVSRILANVVRRFRKCPRNPSKSGMGNASCTTKSIRTFSVPPEGFVLVRSLRMEGRSGDHPP